MLYPGMWWRVLDLMVLVDCNERSLAVVPSLKLLSETERGSSA